MADNAVIQHLGIVSETIGSLIKVNIQASSACSACHAKSACGMGDHQDKIIDINDSEGHYEKGEQVMVKMEQSLGLKAVFFGYLLPFIVLLLTLIISLQLTEKEGLSGLIALFILAPYYFILCQFRGKMSKTFTFRIQKLN
ncbi:MAG: Fis family transcriptional regulator [Bacteroidetes bacterium HGW-Bacteroidetes-21]|jgi:sigma-E factor negative regulatory protein RseC|nr:MAG: Fis family transcriptional regulator [Bacteroidetes bacterium HGW-Bacteroidetes-21]